MNIFDYVLIGIVAFFFIIGYFKGFIKTILKIAAFAVSIIVSILFAKKLAEILMNKTPIDEWLMNIIHKLVCKIPLAGATLVEQEGVWGIFNEGTFVSMAEALTNLIKIPMPDYLLTLIEPYYKADISVASMLSPVITANVIAALAGALIFIVVGIIAKIIIRILRRFLKVVKLGWLDRLLGAVLHIIFGVAFIYCAMFVVDLLSSIDGLKSVIEMRDSSKLAKLFSGDNNLVSQCIKWITEKLSSSINIGGMIDSVKTTIESAIGK